MNIQVETYGQVAVLKCKGEMTADTLDVFAKEVDRHLSDGAVDVIVNMMEVPFVDSACLEYLLDLEDRLRENLGQLTLTNLEENITAILDMTRLSGSFEICDEAANAIRAL